MSEETPNTPEENVPGETAEETASSQERSAAEVPEAATSSEDAPRSSEAATPETSGSADDEEAAATSETSGAAEAEEPEAAAEAEEPEAAEEAEVADEAAPAAPKRRGVRRRRGGAEPAQAEKPAAPAPARRRAKRDPNLPIPVVRAEAKYVRSSARKARLVCDNIRGKSVEEARAILAHTPRAIARDWSKLLESAVANAEHNHELVGEDLYVKAVHADEGPTIKRFQPRAMGRATKIRKRTSHLTILLTPKD
jgi:ribosomal protein L22